MKLSEELRIINTVCPRNCYGGCSMEIHVKKGRILKIRCGGNNPASEGKLCLIGLK